MGVGEDATDATDAADATALCTTVASTRNKTLATKKITLPFVGVVVATAYKNLIYYVTGFWFS
jgi:hypothetical protein